MASASITTRYDAAENKTYAAGTLAFDNSDLNLTAAVADTSTLLSGGVSLQSIALEKPNSFSINYNVPERDVRFQFIKSCNVLKKPVQLRYLHARAPNYTSIGSKFELDSANTVSSKYDFGAGDSKIKYSYSHKGLTMVEPGYNFGTKAWKLAVSHKFNGDDVVKASYKSDQKVLGVDIVKNSGDQSFKVSASLNLAEKLTFPTVHAQSTWNFNI
ncbi:Outer envelope pore protein 24, chloroplastic [Heracleum sosnowskyi]|uniref:Outer envelope pore protein 24, chloroplastic n=1 Tax=Heracleum sosnowskyi TaxID=360622 RepID=A0AAD8M1V2_9APIA|nr:Outer envelope pore protein 24, chloroplastic [Heracleum sosnowskyi]